VSKGDEAGEYAVTGEGGKRYCLHGSNSVDLSKHFGHKVTVTGTKMREENGKKERMKPEVVITPISGSRISST